MTIASALTGMKPLSTSKLAQPVSQKAVDDGRGRPRSTSNSLSFIEQCCDGLRRFILVRVGGDPHIADDLLQQTFCIASGRSSMPEQADECEAWLRGVARNLIRRRWRDLKRMGRHIPIVDGTLARQLAEDMETRPLPPDVLLREESSTQLKLAITSLPSADQHILFAFYFEGRSQAEIADDMKVTAKSVETRLYRVRIRLRTILNNLGKDW